MARSMDNSGSIISSIRSLETRAIHNFIGSTLGDGIDWTRRKSCSWSATSVAYIFPSADFIFSCPIFSDNSLPSARSFRFRSDQYFLGRSVSTSAAMISITEKYHFSSASFQAVLICFSPNSCICSKFDITIYVSSTKLRNRIFCCKRKTLWIRQKFMHLPQPLNPLQQKVRENLGEGH